MKKLIFFLIIVIIIGVGGYLLWLYLRPGALTPPGVGGGPPTAPGGTEPLVLASSARPVFDYWLTRSTGEVYYLAKRDGYFYKVTESGEAKLSAQPIVDFNSLRASFDGTLALVSFGTPSNPTFSVFDTRSASWQALPDGTTAAAWNPNRAQLAYLKNGAVSALNLLNFDDQETAEVVKLNQEDLGLEWLLDEEIYLVQKPASGVKGSVWSVNLRTKKLRSVIKDESGLMVVWSPDGELGLKLYRRDAEKDSRLDFINNQNQSLGPVPITTTLPLKCVFDNTQIYCGVPKSLPSGLILPDDYLKRQVYFDDSIINWDTGTGVLKTVLDSNPAPIDTEHLTKYVDKLFFINRYDSKLYNLTLVE